jgi:hypothetical protein
VRRFLTLLAGPALGLVQPTPVIAPGHEVLLLEMLASPDPLPGGCELLGAQVERAHVTARYQCADPVREVTLELLHPSATPEGAERTARFAVVGRGPEAPPPGLLPAIASRVRAREARFVWDEIDADGPDPARPRPVTTRPWRALVLAALLAVPLLGLLLRARLGSARTRGVS